jgi:hypothetical protein
MPDPTQMTRRVFLTRAAGLTLTLGTGSILAGRASATVNPYAGGWWLAGDHHIHTKYSPDGLYEIAEQVAAARRYGLDWCVITDHGGPHHDKVALSQAYPELLAARRANPGLTVFQGVEWNIPAAEHGSVILPVGAEEAQHAATFEAIFDAKNTSLPGAKNTEAIAVQGVQYLESITPKPLFIANHPARRGLDSPHEMRAWSDAGPNVARGFEGAPGHQAGGLAGKARGEYDNKPSAESFSGYPAEAYRTFGGYDWYVAKVGGLWDSLLGEGRPWYITADSDSHKHWDERALVDQSTYLTKGYVTRTGQMGDALAEPDFYPGEYAKTWAFARRRNPEAILDALRSGSMFTVLGGLVDRLEMWTSAQGDAATMGGTLAMAKPGSPVDVTIRLRVPNMPNFGGETPQLHHVDLIAGDIIGPAADRDALANPTTRVVAQLRPPEARREGPYLVFRHRFENVRSSFYLRVRGSNTEVDAPVMDVVGANPWKDLWFYSNPVFVRLPGV